VSHCRFVLNAK
jgi:hypothetical protein